MKIMLDIERDFVLDLGALQLFEDLTGEMIFDNDTFAKFTSKKLSALLYAGLKSGGCELTQKETDALVTSSRMAAVMRTMRMVLQEMGGAEEKNA